MDNTSAAMRQARGPFLILVICVLLALLPRPERKPDRPPPSHPDNMARQTLPQPQKE